MLTDQVGRPRAVGVVGLLLVAAGPYFRGPDRGPAGGYPQGIDGHDLIMFALLAAIALRPLVWSGLQTLMAGHIELLLGVGLLQSATPAALAAALAMWWACRQVTPPRRILIRP